MTRVVVFSAAESEFLGAVRHYNRQGPGLGYEFAAEVKAAFARITAFPDAPGLPSRPGAGAAS